MAEHLNNETPQENRKRRRNFNERVQENDEKQRSVSFTKRRYGLFNKATELFMLCDAQLAVLVSSTKGNRKIYSIGYPSVNSVLDDYLNIRKPNPVDDGDKHYALSLFNQIKELEDEVKNITEKGKKLKNGVEGLSSVLEFFENSESVEELQALVNGLEKLRVDVKTRVDNRTVSCVASNDHGSGSSLFSEKGKGKLIDSNMITDVGLPSFKFGCVNEYEKNNLSDQDHDENWKNYSDYYNYPSCSDDHQSPLVYENLGIDDDPFEDSVVFDGFWSN